MSYYVEVREYAGDEEDDVVIRRLGPYSEREAEKADAGLTRQINHDKFYTLIVESEAP